MKYLIEDLKVNPRTPIEVRTYTHTHMPMHVNVIEILTFYVRTYVYVHTFVYMQGVGEILHVASGKGHLNVVKYLIEDCHVDPTCVGQVQVYTYIHMLIQKNMQVIPYTYI